MGAETLSAEVPTFPITFQPPAPTQVLRAYFEPHICLDELASHLAARMALPLAHVQAVLSSKPRSKEFAVLLSLALPNSNSISWLMM